MLTVAFKIGINTGGKNRYCAEDDLNNGPNYADTSLSGPPLPLSLLPQSFFPTSPCLSLPSCQLPQHTITMCDCYQAGRSGGSQIRGLNGISYMAKGTGLDMVMKAYTSQSGRQSYSYCNTLLSLLIIIEG